MKALLFAAAIAIGGTAFAQQTMPPANSGPPAPAATTDTMTPPDSQPMATPTDSQMATPTDTAAPMATPTDTSAPTDSAMPMTAPDSAAPMDNKGMSTATPAADYPTCSRTVTDKCMQGGMAKKHKKKM